MRNLQTVVLILSAVIMHYLVGCSDTDQRPVKEEEATDSGLTNTGPTDTGLTNTGPTVVYVTNYPLKYFAERIGGEHVTVHFPAPSGDDPAYWMPGPETISNYQQADLILLNGAGYEKWTEAVSLPRSKLCQTSSPFTSEEFILLEDAVTHSHGPEGEHAHGGMAFTTWLDPTLAVKQADAIRSALAELRPKHADAFRQAYEALRSDLEALDQEIADIVMRASDQPVLFSHPVYQYFERRYGLKARSVHWEPDEAPTDAMWAELKELLVRHPTKWMIWENEPLGKTADKLAELGLSSSVYDPCANTPGEGDYLTVQRKNLVALANIYSESP
jgi:zinc transport system substrate-binding protein